jgi:hypothetical protein
MQQPFASEGHCVRSPLHTSSVSHELVDARHTVMAGAYSAEQAAAHAEVLRVTQAAGGPPQAMPFMAFTLSAGQTGMLPVQLSVASHSPVDGRQGVPAAWNRL